MDSINCVTVAFDECYLIHVLAFHHHYYPMMWNFGVNIELIEIGVSLISIDVLTHGHAHYVHVPIDFHLMLVDDNLSMDYYLRPKNDVIECVAHHLSVDLVIDAVALGSNTVTVIKLIE